MQDCSTFYELANLSVDGLLTPDQEKALEGHLSVCPNCQRRVQAAQTIRDAIGDMEENPPDTLMPGLMSRISFDEKHARSWKRFIPHAATLVAACIVVVFAVLINQGVFSDKTPPPESGGALTSDLSRDGEKAVTSPAASSEQNSFAANSPAPTAVEPSQKHEDDTDSLAGPDPFSSNVLFGVRVFCVMICPPATAQPEGWKDYQKHAEGGQTFVLVPKAEFEAFSATLASSAIADDSPDFDKDSDYAMVVFLD